MAFGESSVSRWVCPWQVRFQFNTMGFDDRVASGELRIDVIRDDPAPRSARQARGMHSQTIQYVTATEWEPLAECHRYIQVRGRNKGQLGGSGRPDPQWLVVGEEEWNIAHRDEDPNCPDCVIWEPRVRQMLLGEPS